MPFTGSALGSTPFGISSPTEAPLPSSDGPALSRFINVGSGDFELDTKIGQLRQMPAVRQRILLIVQTQLGSSTALRTLGIRRPGKVTQSFAQQLKFEVRRAFSRLTDIEKVITLREIRVESRGGGRTSLVIEYEDHTVRSGDNLDSLETLL